MIIRNDANADHELKVAAITRRIGFDFISVSPSLRPSIKILDGATSACVDAYLTPHTKRYVDGFSSSFSTLPGRIEFMLSDGGLAVGEKPSGLKATSSGPAGGAVAIANTYYDQEEGASTWEVQVRMSADSRRALSTCLILRLVE